MTPEERDEPKCRSCGVPFIEHLGLQGTCKALRERDATIAAKDAEIERLRNYMRIAIRGSLQIRELRGRQLWSCVGWLFGHGSGYATKLCQEFGFDPDATALEEAT